MGHRPMCTYIEGRGKVRIVCKQMFMTLSRKFIAIICPEDRKRHAMLREGVTDTIPGARQSSEMKMSVKWTFE